MGCIFYRSTRKELTNLLWTVINAAFGHIGVYECVEVLQNVYNAAVLTFGSRLTWVFIAPKHTKWSKTGDDAQQTLILKRWPLISC